MASLSPEAHRSTPRRASSRSSSRRPRLLRACATEPSITASNASRDALANPQTSRRATDLLNQVAYFSASPPDSIYRSSSPLSPRSPMLGGSSRREGLPSPAAHNVDLDGFRPDLHSGRYYSFPSFDTWEMDQPDEEKTVEMKSP